MADSPAGSKTEKPTPRRLQEARERGQVAKSQDLNGAVVLGAAALLMYFMGPYTYNSIFAMTRQLLSGDVGFKHMTTANFYAIYDSLIHTTLLLVAPFFIGILALSILSNVIQIKPLFTVKTLQPKMDKINPINGFKRMWSMRSVVEVVKGLLKMTIIGVAGTSVIMSRRDQLMGLGGLDTDVGWLFILETMGQVTVWSVIIFLFLGLLDWWYQKYELDKQLKMTRQEVKDERKNEEGNPLIKGHVRKLGIEMSRKRQLSEVPKADVIVTNPTHISIAIKYDPDISPSPRVVAKGQEHFAFKIREIAKEYNIPLVENKPLARTLYQMVEVGDMIPPHLFVAVAEVLAYVFTKNKGRRPKRSWVKKTT